MKQLQDSDRRYKEVSLNRYLCSAILSEISAQSFYHINKEKQLKEQLFHDILDYISWHIQERLSISEIAAYFGYNEKYFTTFFKKYAGIPLKQHILQSKMEHAKSNLSETTQPISQIAYSLGFSDAHNFSNAFHKVTGLSPSEYRASYNKHNVFQK
jgi:AraC-like DNA-binding protein